jgi:ferredoxin
MDEPAVAVSVDTARCVGSATCIVVAAGLFELNEHDRAEPIAPVVTDVEAAEQAAELCPTAAIHLERVAAGRPR